MASDLETIKTVGTIAAPLTAAIIETWVKPKLVALYRFIKTDKALFEHSLNSKFNEYLLRSYEKNSFISVIVFQNQQRKLEDIYVPLSLKEARGRKEIIVNNYRKNFIPAYKKVLIRDSAGMGKSTVMKYLFLSCINNNEGIPIFIELRKLKSGESVLSYIYNELNAVEKEFDKDLVLELIKTGGFVFFLDGYDEIPFSERDQVTNHLQDFIWKAGKNLFILTSRPESSLASFSDFQEFNIQPLELDEAFALLGKYDHNGILSAEIISKLEGGTLENIKEFLKNPLLVSLLYKSYEYKPIIPFKKHIFYRQVYDALFESHDLTKGGSFIREKYSDLDIEDFHRALRALGFISVKLGQIEFGKDELLALLREAKEHCPGIDFKEAGFLKDLLTTVPLFNRDGEYYKWAHKSIQEYFAAQFIWLDAKGQQTKILRQLVSSKNYSRYYNVLDLYYDMDYKTFRQTIIYDLISDFIKYYNTSYALIDRGEISEEEIHLRKTLTFAKLFICVSRKDMKEIEKGKLDKIEHILRRAAESKERYEMDWYWSQGIVRCRGYKEIIAGLLLSKGCDVFNYSLLASETDVETDLFEQDFTKEVAYELDDSPSKLCNHKNRFAIVNRLLAESDGPFLDIVKCQKLKLEIQRERKKEASGDFFSDL